MHHTMNPDRQAALVNTIVNSLISTMIPIMIGFMLSPVFDEAQEIVTLPLIARLPEIEPFLPSIQRLLGLAVSLFLFYRAERIALKLKEARTEKSFKGYLASIIITLCAITQLGFGFVLMLMFVWS